MSDGEESTDSSTKTKSYVFGGDREEMVIFEERTKRDRESES